MPKSDPMKVIKKFFKDADDVAKIATGRRLMELGSLAMSMLRNGPVADPDDPYTILGIQRTASDRVVKFAYRACAFDFHPDTGAHPDQKKFQRATEAYDRIERERKQAG